MKKKKKKVIKKRQIFKFLILVFFIFLLVKLYLFFDVLIKDRGDIELVLKKKAFD